MYIPYYPHINKRLSAEIDELIAQLEAESHADPGQDSSIRERAIRLVYLARQHDRIQQHYCNDTLPNWKRLRTERREKRIEIEITHIAATFSATPIFRVIHAAQPSNWRLPAVIQMTGARLVIVFQRSRSQQERRVKA
jgi:hypothetical protein